MEFKPVFKAHPWHGIPLGEEAPAELTAFIEIVPTDTVKYEVDKQTGYLSLDRPQKFSNIVPSLYGFFPRTYCSTRTAEPAARATGMDSLEGDRDPLDVCVLTEKDVTHGDIILKVRPIGGLRLLDNGQADDKIIAVMRNDAVYGSFRDIEELPEDIVRRLIHYFRTYKDIPGECGSCRPRMEYIGKYGASEARDIILRAMEDYEEEINKRTEI